MDITFTRKFGLSLRVGEELPVHCENANDHDPFAIAACVVLKDDTIISHVPREIFNSLSKRAAAR